MVGNCSSVAARRNSTSRGGLLDGEARVGEEAEVGDAGRDGPAELLRVAGALVVQRRAVDHQRATPSWNAATGDGRRTGRVPSTPSSRTRNGSISSVWRSKERLVAGCSAPSTPSRKSANASTCSARAGRASTGARSSSTPSSSVVQSCCRACEVRAASEVAPFSRSCSAASLAAFASTTSTCVRTSHAPRRAGRPLVVSPSRSDGLPDRCDVDAVERRAASGPPRRRSRARRRRGGGPCAARRPWPPPTPRRRTRRRRRRAGGSPPRAAAPRARRVHRRGHQGGRSCCAG